MPDAYNVTKVTLGESLSLRICKLIHVVTGALWAADALVCPNLNSIDSVSLMKEITVW